MNKVNRIYIYSTGMIKGGAENQLSKIAIYLKKKTDFDIKIIYFTKANDFVEKLNDNRIPFEYYNIKSISGLFAFIKNIREYKPDLIISFMFGAGIVARISKLLFKIPIITSVRNSKISRGYKILYKITYRLDDLTTFNSKYALEKFIKEGITSKQGSLVVNNVVEVPIDNIDRESNNSFVIVSLAHFRPAKDYLTLFKAISLLKKENISVKLYALGHTNNQSWPFEKIRDLKIEDNVVIVGFTDEVEKYLNMSDALVLSSLWEGTPNAILEGMAYQLPIIASNIRGSSDLVNSAQCGLLFEPQNSIDLKDTIIRMMSFTEDKRRQMGSKGYKYVMENFGEDKVMNKWLSLIERVLMKSK